MALVITPEGSSAITFLDLIIDFDQHAGRYWQFMPRVCQQTFKKMTHGGAGQDGRFITRFGADTTPIKDIILWYVTGSASPAAALVDINALFQADAAAMANVANALDLPGNPGDAPACECVNFEMIREPHGRLVVANGNGFYRTKVAASFEQLR